MNDGSDLGYVRLYPISPQDTDRRVEKTDDDPHGSKSSVDTIPLKDLVPISLKIDDMRSYLVFAVSLMMCLGLALAAAIVTTRHGERWHYMVATYILVALVVVIDAIYWYQVWHALGHVMIETPDRAFILVGKDFESKGQRTTEQHGEVSQ